jgi:hypothetical protein
MNIVFLKHKINILINMMNIFIKKNGSFNFNKKYLKNKIIAFFIKNEKKNLYMHIK